MATEKKRVTGYIGQEIESDWKAYVEHLGISESAALEWAIRAELRRFKGENTRLAWSLDRHRDRRHEPAAPEIDVEA